MIHTSAIILYSILLLLYKFTSENQQVSHGSHPVCCGRTTVSCAFFPLCAFFGQKWLRSWVYPFICVNFNMIIFVYSQELLLLHNIVWKEHSTKGILPQFKCLRFLVPLQNDALSCLKRSKLLANWFARNWDCLLSHFQTHAPLSPF